MDFTPPNKDITKRINFSDLQSKMLQCQEISDIFSLIPDKIREILGDGIVLTTMLNEDIQAMNIVAYSGLNISLEKVIKIVGSNPLKSSFYLRDMTMEELNLFRSGRLAILDGGLHALTVRKYPKTVCRILENVLGINSVFTMGCVFNDIHYGGLIILTKDDIFPYKEIIEQIMNQAAILIQRIVVEKSLLKEKEQKIKTENNYRNLFQQNIDGCAIHELLFDRDNIPVDYITLDVNPAYEKLLDVRKSDVINVKASEILPKEELKKWLNIFAPVAINGGSYSYENYSPVNEKYFEGIAYSLEKYQFVVIFRDVTERKLQEDLIRESRKRFKLLTELSMEGILLHKEGIIEEVNPAVEKLLKAKREELIGLDLIKNFVTVNMQDKVLYQIKQDFSGPYEAELISTEGDKRTVEITSYFLSKKDNLRASVIRDISVQKETDKLIMKAIIEAEENEKNYFSKELHDGLGPILSSLNMYFDWLSNTTDESEKKMILENGLQNIKAAVNTVEEISNKLSPRILNTMGLTAALETYLGRLKKSNSLRIEFESNLTTRLTLHHEAAIYRVLTELISNTMKHANANVIGININFSKTNNSLKVKYSDNGIGFNFHKKIKDAKGLGLLNMQERIKTLDGSILFQTRPGEGLKVELNFKNLFLSE